MRNYFYKIMIFTFSTFLTIVAVEWFLSAIDYKYYPLDLKVLGASISSSDSDDVFESDWRIKHSFNDESYIYDSVLIWVPNKEQAIITSNGSTCLFYNSYGFPGPEFFPDNRDGKHRIISLGDSNTVGYSYYDENSGRIGYPALLQQMLDGQYEVINGGVSGYSSYQILKKYFNILEYKPNIVIVSATTNDAQLVGKPDSQYSIVTILETKLFLNSKIIQVLQQVKDKYSKRKRDTLVPRVSTELYSEILDELIKNSKANGIRLILLTRPYSLKNIDPPGKLMKSYNDLLIEKARQNHIEFIDAQDFFGNKTEYFSDVNHLNKEGLRVLAEKIHKVILGSSDSKN